MAKTKTNTLQDFQRAHDPDVRVPEAIKAGLALLAKQGPTAWLYESDFIQLCPGVANNNIGKYREQFAKHLVVARLSNGTHKNVWFAAPKVAAKARG